MKAISPANERDNFSRRHFLSSASYAEFTQDAAVVQFEPRFLILQKLYHYRSPTKHTKHTNCNPDLRAKASVKMTILLEGAN